MSDKHDWVQIWNDSVEEMKPHEKKIIIPSDFYGSEDIRKLGISCGDNCLLHKTTIVVNPEKLTMGNNVRIDGFCTLSCGTGIFIGSYVHIAGYVTLMGGAGIEVGDYASIASGAKLYSVSDDIMGRGLVGPCVNKEDRYLHSRTIILEEHSVLAVNTVLMPGSKVSYGGVVLPFSLLLEEVPRLSVFGGSPAKFIKDRKINFLNKV